MNEEENKAIEKLKDFKSISILYGNTFTMFLDQLEKYQEATNTVLNLITKLQKENEILEFQEEQIRNYAEELKKYDYRNIKIDKKDELKSASIPKEHLDLMNLGIALYIGIPKLLEDEEETDI